MGATYAVKWREPDGISYVGRLALDVGTLHLEGRGSDGTPVDRRIAYGEVSELGVGAGQDRLDGRPALVVARGDDRYLVASAGWGAGIVQEVVERIAELRRDGRTRARWSSRFGTARSRPCVRSWRRGRRSIRGPRG
jgi:hypothetical protein